MQSNEPLRHYLITDPKQYSNNAKEFQKKLHQVLEKNPVQMACFRDKESCNYDELAKLFVQICQEHKVEQILLNENLELAHQLQCGIHLTSKQFHLIKEAKKRDMYVIISCHNIHEIEKAQKEFVHAITYSPIFETPNKGEAKGIANLKKILSLYDMNIIALGGIIKEEHMKQIAQTKAYGFASIRYFLN